MHIICIYFVCKYGICGEKILEHCNHTQEIQRHVAILINRIFKTILVGIQRTHGYIIISV